MAFAPRLIAAVLIGLAPIAPGGERSPRVPDLPDSLPDIPALIGAETPVTVASEDRRTPDPDLTAIRLRHEQGDRGEAFRRFVAYADAHRGSPWAAEALFESARSLLGEYQAPDRQDLERIGTIALRMAEENREHPLTLRVLWMYVNESLRARNTQLSGRPSIEPHREEWSRVFRAAAILAGRYPEDRRSNEALLSVAGVLAAAGRPEAAGLFRRVAESAAPADLRFRAFRILHDAAFARGDVGEAQRTAELAARECAGKNDPPRWRPREEKDEGPSPWADVLLVGIPSRGPALLERPEWRSGASVFIRFSRRERLERDGRWVLESPPERLSEIGSLDAGPEGAVVCARPVFEFRSPCMAVLGETSLAPPGPDSLAFVPRFPVREGEEIFPYAGALLRQSARAEGEGVRVQIDAGSFRWIQHWPPGGSWWERGGVLIVADIAGEDPLAFHEGTLDLPGLPGHRRGWLVGDHRLLRQGDRGPRPIPAALTGASGTTGAPDRSWPDGPASHTICAMATEPETWSEEEEWALLTPQERFEWTLRLWEHYLAIGGSLDPEPDSQSPFDFPEMRGPLPPHGGTGMHHLRRG
jgi:hypothetical protein